MTKGGCWGCATVNFDSLLQTGVYCASAEACMHGQGTCMHLLHVCSLISGAPCNPCSADCSLGIRAFMMCVCM